MTNTLLIVDDEQNVLRALKRSLRGQGYEIILAQGGEEAIEILNKRPISVLLTDQRMPNVAGNQVIQMAKWIQPDCQRLLISGYCDFEALVHAINEGDIQQMIAKPWLQKDLQQTIRMAFNQYHENLIMRLQRTGLEDMFVAQVLVDASYCILSMNQTFAKQHNTETFSLIGKPLANVNTTLADCLKTGFRTSQSQFTQIIMVSDEFEEVKLMFSQFKREKQINSKEYHYVINLLDMSNDVVTQQ